jgi:hypothetical protein
MPKCAKCYAQLNVTFERIGQAVFCDRCDTEPYRLTRASISILLLGGAAYLPIAAMIFVELFDVDPSKLIVGRNQSQQATAGTVLYLLGALAWLFYWWRLWKQKFAKVAVK